MELASNVSYFRESSVFQMWVGPLTVQGEIQQGAQGQQNNSHGASALSVLSMTLTWGSGEWHAHRSSPPLSVLAVCLSLPGGTQSHLTLHWISDLLSLELSS